MCGELHNNQPSLLNQEELRGPQHMGVLVMQWGVYSQCVKAENESLRAEKQKCS